MARMFVRSDEYVLPVDPGLGGAVVPAPLHAAVEIRDPVSQPISDVRISVVHPQRASMEVALGQQCHWQAVSQVISHNAGCKEGSVHFFNFVLVLVLFITSIRSHTKISKNIPKQGWFIVFYSRVMVVPSFFGIFISSDAHV